MLEIQKWGKGKSPLLAMFASMTASSAGEFHEGLQHIKERRLYSHQFPLPDFPSWFAHYRSPLKAVLATMELIGEISEFGKDLRSLLFGIRALHKILKRSPDKIAEFKPSPQELKEVQEIIRGLNAKMHQEIEEDILDIPVDHEQKAQFFQYLDKHEQEIAFCFLVYFPCFLLYQTWPTYLYREALNGDVQALKNLVRLDPLLLHDPTIGQQIQALRFNHKLNDYEMILDAAKKPLKFTHTEISKARKKLKYNLAALISSIATEMKQPLTTTQIRGVFDDYARDSNGNLIDTDFGSPEAFDQAMKREIPKWQVLFQNSDKSK